MTVIVGLRVPSRELEIGRLLDRLGDVEVSVVGTAREGDSGVILYSVEGGTDRFPEVVEQHPSISSVEPIDGPTDDDVYAATFETLPKGFWGTLEQFDVELIRARHEGDVWDVEVAIEDQDQLAAFREMAEEADLPVDVDRRFNPCRAGSGPWFGLTEPQREALSLALREGYFEIPRRCTIADLAGEFDISDQAMSERLRRAIGRLVGNTMMMIEEGQAEQ